MIDRIIIHIGAPKCGSTFLQEVMRKNSSRLLENGIYYPHDGREHPGNAADLSVYDAEYISRASEQGVETLVLSHEDLIYLPDQPIILSNTITNLNISVQVVAFIRPFSEIIFGDFSQHMKQFFEEYLETRNPYGGESFNSFALNRVNCHKLCENLMHWQTCFNAQPIIIRQHRHIEPVFKDILGLDLDWQLPAAEANISLRVEDCENIVNLMHDVQVPNEDIRLMFEQAFQVRRSGDNGRSIDRVKLIEAAASNENECLFKNFGVDNTLPESVGV